MPYPPTNTHTHTNQGDIRTHSHFSAISLEDNYPPSLVTSRQELSIVIELHSRDDVSYRREEITLQMAKETNTFELPIFSFRLKSPRLATISYSYSPAPVHTECTEQSTQSPRQSIKDICGDRNSRHSHSKYTSAI